VLVGQDAQVSLEGGWSAAADQAPSRLVQLFLLLVRR
jgi:hypothetical protein